jgi:hypothetical protein
MPHYFFMNLLLPKKGFIAVVCCLLIMQRVEAQFLMDMIDTTKDMGKSMLSLYKKFDGIRISGYIQPQFQWVGEKGARTFSGGDFAARSNNRFMLRRGRLRFDYFHLNHDHKPQVQFVFQFDGTERGVFIRDFWGRLFDTRYEVFSLTMGMFARPFGYEVNLSSSDRESPERGRMSQLHMRTERDLGAMISFEPRKKDHPLRYFKWDIGVFNGQGLAGPGEYDSYKDIISRVALKPYPVSRQLTLSTGVSVFNGGFVQNSKFRFNTTTDNGGNKIMVADSSLSNIGSKAPRRYWGADLQLKWKRARGNTELRAEYWRGTQTATAASAETPGTLPLEADQPAPLYQRRFDGAFFYLLHNIFNQQHQLCLKYDWYDPNTRVKGIDIGRSGANINATNIRYNTLGIGYIYYVNESLKWVFWYEHITNEKTQLAGFTRDVKDNVLTCRLQFRF